LSFSFQVVCPPPEASILRSLHMPFTLLDTAPTGSWPDGTVLRGFIPEVSTRCVETSWRNGRFEARILALSCPEDYALAIALCRTVAGEAGVWVQSEDGQWFDPSDLGSYGSGWIEQHIRGVTQTVLQMALDHEEPLEVLGLPEPYVLQKDFAKELLETHEPSRQDRLFGHIREVVYGLTAVPLAEAEPAPALEEVTEPPAKELDLDDGSEHPTADAAPRVSLEASPPASEMSASAPVALEVSPSAHVDDIVVVAPSEPSASGISSTWIGVGFVGVAAALGIGWMLTH
jgi:hypothetical protein